MKLNKSTFSVGQELIVENLPPTVHSLSIYKMEELHKTLDRDSQGTFRWILGPEVYGSFSIVDNLGNFRGFDVLESWTNRPRYGFLCNFDGAADSLELAENLTKYSSNAAQFYDWHFRHENLVSPEDEFVDPLGRRMRHSSTKDIIMELRRHGIASMGYVAAYATSNKGAIQHPEWLLYDSKGHPQDFHGFLKITDVSRGAPFLDVILDESEKALEAMGFSGIHFDQYGEPRDGFDLEGKHKNVGDALVEVINRFKARNAKIPSTLNAVKNWPRELLTKTNQDFYYMELWEETNGSIGDLVQDILYSRIATGNKGVVVAIYIKQANAGSNSLVDSIIHALGAWRIEFGQLDGFLSDPYFPEYELASPTLASYSQRQNDFAVAMGDSIRLSVPEVRYIHEDECNLAVISYVCGVSQAIGLVNLGLCSAETPWGEPIKTPSEVKDFIFELPEDWHDDGVHWFSSDCPTGQVMLVTYDNETPSVRIPALTGWGLIKGKTK